MIVEVFQSGITDQLGLKIFTRTEEEAAILWHLGARKVSASVAQAEMVQVARYKDDPIEEEQVTLFIHFEDPDPDE